MNSDLKFIYKVRKVIKFMIVQNVTSEHFNTKEDGCFQEEEQECFTGF